MVLSIRAVKSRDRNTVDNLLIDPDTPGGQQPAGQSSGWALTFSDEFNGSSINSARWDWAYPNWPRFNAQSPGGRYTNTDNANCYAADHVTFSGGVMTLTCEQTETITGLPYTSGMLSSYGRFQQQYGFFECRLRVPDIYVGGWPAAWMSCSDYDQWPPEIDYFENFGQYNVYDNNVYLPGGNNSHVEISSGVDVRVWATYGVMWTPSGTTFYRNGTQTSTTARSPGTEQYMIINMAARVPANPTFTSATMEVEYFRAWEAV